MILNSILGAFGVFIFLFTFWKKNKEDYTSSQVFSAGFLVLIFLFLFLFISRLSFSSWWFWFGFFGVILGFLAGWYRFRLRFYETLDSIVISFLPWLGLVYLSDSIVNYSLASLFAFVFVVLLIFFYLFLNNKYKDFTWYRSGKVGFSGIAVLGTFFIFRGLIAILYPDMISFVGNYDAIISEVCAFASFLMLYNLARSQ